jgi:hypothetical protein
VSPKARKVYEALRDKFDNDVQSLSRDEYKDVCEELHAHVQCCLDCIAEEDGADA